MPADDPDVDVVYIANLSNQSADCFPTIVSRAKAHHALVAANPGPRQLSARGHAFLECISSIDILALNRDPRARYRLRRQPAFAGRVAVDCLKIVCPVHNCAFHSLTLKCAK